MVPLLKKNKKYLIYFYLQYSQLIYENYILCKPIFIFSIFKHFCIKFTIYGFVLVT